MSTTLEEPLAPSDASHGQRLRTTMAAMRLSFTWFGTVRLMYPV